MKFRSQRAAAIVLANLVLESFDLSGKVIVPLPTIAKHKRSRGFGQTELIAKYLERFGGLEVAQVLVRKKDSVQVGSSSEMRVIQAKEAYSVVDDIDTELDYVLLDDVWTTGASLLSAAQKMHSRGVHSVDILALSKTIG